MLGGETVKPVGNVLAAERHLVRKLRAYLSLPEKRRQISPISDRPRQQQMTLLVATFRERFSTRHDPRRRSDLQARRPVELPADSCEYSGDLDRVGTVCPHDDRWLPRPRQPPAPNLASDLAVEVIDKRAHAS